MRAGSSPDRVFKADNQLTGNAMKKRYGTVTRNNESFEVEIMAESGSYYMVRRKGCMPFVAHKKELTIDI